MVHFSIDPSARKPMSSSRPKTGLLRGLAALSLGLLMASLTSCRHDSRATAVQGPPASIEVPDISRPGGETAQWWFRSGAAVAHRQGAGDQPARNLILFVGDGMGVTTVSAARIFAGQRLAQPGEEYQLSFERFPQLALAKTYNTNAQTPDSAGTMTAMASGIKTQAGVIGVDQTVIRGDCASAQAASVPALLELAEDAGLSSGLVTTTRITHATPAATYAHVPERNWEADAEMPDEALAQGCADIARQLIEFDHGNGLDVVLGGGRGAFLPATQADPEHAGESGAREDGVNLIDSWLSAHPEGDYVWNEEQFKTLDPQREAPVLGLFEPSHMQYELDRGNDPAGEPSLAEMTRFAIEKLQASGSGYVLVVEGGRIDHAHHAGNAHRALVDTLAFADAVAVADRLTAVEDTLILVTADHSHTLTFAGYPARGNPILGKVVGPAQGPDRPGKQGLDALGLPYTTLGYANGPGYSGASDSQAEGAKRFPHRAQTINPILTGRPDLGDRDTTAPDYLQEAVVPLPSETHGGEDVAVYARGPGSEAVRGVLEQHVLFHILIQAQPALRQSLCARGACADTGTPIDLLSADGEG